MYSTDVKLGSFALAEKQFSDKKWSHPEYSLITGVVGDASVDAFRLSGRHPISYIFLVHKKEGEDGLYVARYVPRDLTPVTGRRDIRSEFAKKRPEGGRHIGIGEHGSVDLDIAEYKEYLERALQDYDALKDVDIGSLEYSEPMHLDLPDVSEIMRRPSGRMPPQLPRSPRFGLAVHE